MPPIAPAWSWLRKKAPFPCSTRNAYLARPHIQALPPDIYNAIAAHGIRNALLTSIAPTGTISLFAGQCLQRHRAGLCLQLHAARCFSPTAASARRQVADYAVRAFRGRFGPDAALPDYFVNAQTLTPADHLAVQAAAQPFIDSAISKTINVPARHLVRGFRRCLSRSL